MPSLFGNKNFVKVGDSGKARALKLAAIYIKNNTDEKGVVSDPVVYQNAIASYLDGYADDLGVQKVIGDYQNKIKALTVSKAAAANSLSSLKLKEDSSWYFDDDQELSTFRNPELVANSTSQNLDLLVMQTVSDINAQQAAGKDSSELEKYLGDVSQKADRMRAFTADLNGGAPGTAEGYGYFVDSDPNTGVIRGATLAPTDLKISGQDGKVRTDSYVVVGNKKVPVYLPTIKNAEGVVVSNFGGKEYTGDSNKISSGQEEDVSLADLNKYKFDNEYLARGKVYRAYTGESYADGSPKQKAFYRGFDDQVYSFDPSSPEGKGLIDSLAVGGVIDKNNIPKINPYTATQIKSKSLSEAGKDLSLTAIKVNQAQQNAAPLIAESNRLNSQGTFGQLVEGFKSTFFGNKTPNNAPPTPPPQPTPPAQPVSTQVNIPTKPKPAAVTSGKTYSTSDIVEKGKSFFRNLA